MATKEQERQWREDGFSATITCAADEKARGEFRGIHEMFFDEPEFVEVGDEEHPCPHDYLLAAVGGCQVEVLKQCLEKSKLDEYEIQLDLESKKGRTDVDEELPQNVDIRVEEIISEMRLTVPEEDVQRSERCLEVFERNCPITQSVIAGIEVNTSTAMETK